MRKYLAGLFMLFSTAALADDVLWVEPVRIELGSTSDDGRMIAINLDNENVFTALQFDIYFPPGVDLDVAYEPLEMSQDRFPHTIGRGGKITWDHEYSYIKRPGGEYRFLVYSNENKKLNGNSGTLLYLYYTSDTELGDKPLPIVLKNITLAINGTTDVKISECSSFLYTDKTDFSGTSLNLSGLGGLVPSGVASEMSELLVGNERITSLTLPDATTLGAGITSGNPNMLVYASEDVTAPDNVKNLVKGDVCNTLELVDNMPFHATKGFTAATADYSRTVPAAGWYSLCLPYAPTVPVGVEMEKFVSADMSANTITFDAEPSPQAYMPYIFSTESADVRFSGSNVEVSATPDDISDGVFVGTLSGFDAPDIAGFYVLKPDGAGMGIATETAYAAPFRAVVRTSVPQGARSLSVIHGGDATGITQIEDGSATDYWYSMQGIRTSRPGKGVFVKNGRKLIVK
ncbi:MAG: hypothetical protein Q4F85_04635 [Prevotella sp.]|nr:hypothetical protein [Prevotella sp.]